MTVDDAVAGVLARLSDAQLEALAAKCEAHAAPTGSLGQVVAGASPSAVDAVDTLASAWRSHLALTGSGLALSLRIGLRARRGADARGSRPVWTGPETIGEQRLTAAVLHELLTAARERILLVSFAAYTLPEVAADLEAAVARRSEVDVVFETTTDSAGRYDGPSRPFGTVGGINRWCWPAEQRHVAAVLHAKLLVIDGRRAFIGSANLTHKALHANLEAGLLVNDADVAAELEGHVRQLMATGVLRRD